MSDSEDKKKGRLWVVDPAIFKGRPSTKLGRIKSTLESIGKLAAFAVLIGVYPLALVILGIFYGGIAFWGSFILSVLIIWAGLNRLGYERRFESWNPSLRRQLVGLVLGFILVLGFYFGLTHLGPWMVPILLGGLGLIFVLAVRRLS